MSSKKSLLVILLFIILVNIRVDSQVFAENEKTILIINSNTEDYAWTSNVLKGVFKTINPSEINADIYMENFDYKYYKKSDVEEDIYKLIEDRYSDKK